MKNILKRRFVFFKITLATVIVFFTAGCDNDAGDNIKPVVPPDITVEVRINSSSHDVLRGGEVTFLVSVKETTDKTVTWSIDEENKHQETKIYINGKKEVCLSVSEDETLGTLTIRATSNADPEKSGTVKVTIPVPTIEKIEISLPQPWVDPWQGKVDVGTDGKIEFTAKVTGKDFIREAVTWSIDNKGKNNNTTISIDNNGVAQLHVAQGETLTSFKVQAVSKWDTGKIGEVTVTVKEPTVTDLVIYDQDDKVVPNGNIAKPSIQIKTSDSESFRAIVTGTGKVNQNVTWKIERLTYLIMIPIIRENKDHELVGGFGEEELEIILDNDTSEVFTWFNTDVPSTDGYSTIYEKRLIERTPGSKEVTIWNINGGGENEQKTLVPKTGTTGIDATGKFTVDGQETFGKFMLTAVSTADTTIKKEVVVQIDTSSEIGIEPPPEF
jgi:hypothetical protein